MNQPTVKHPARVNPWIGVLVVLAVAIAVNVVAKSVRARIDVTEERLFTLSEGTTAFVENLETPVTLKFYYSRGNEVPSFVKQYAQRILDLLRELEHASGGSIVLETYDPQPDSDEEEWAQRYGLVGQQATPTGLDDPLYIGLVAVSGQREAAIPFLAPNTEAQLEYNVARLVHEVTRVSKPKLGVISSLPVAGRPVSPMMRGRQPDTGWIAMRELRRHYEITTITPDAVSIPEDITALLVIHPKQFPDALTYAIDQYVVGGGRLIVLQDPLSMTERETNPEMASMGMMMSPGSQLNALTTAWGVTMDAEAVLADVAMASPITFGNGQSERLAAWLTARPEQVNRDDAITASINLLMLPFAGALTVTNVEGITATTLLRSTTNAVSINAFMATMPGPEKMRDATPLGEKALAVRLIGRFPSAFTNGPPLPAQGGPEIDASRHLARGEQEGMVVVVSDVDFLYDQHAFRVMNLFGQQMAELANDNFNLMLGLVEQATGSEALMGLRSRGVKDRTFSRVLALEQAAQQRWQSEELNLLTKLQETQRRLGELQAARDDQQQAIITPEQKAEIETFRKQRFETQRELKEVRRNLRREIEVLGFQVKAVNFAAVPVLVALFGIARGIRRRR